MPSKNAQCKTDCLRVKKQSLNDRIVRIYFSVLSLCTAYSLWLCDLGYVG